MQRATWKRVHGELTRLARSKSQYDAEEARWLLQGKQVRVHEPLGFGTYLAYPEHVLGSAPRLASERLRVAEALVDLPAMMGALASGELCWSAVRELTRVTTAATEAEWIAAARGRSVREVEDMVSGRRPGDPADAGAKRHVLRLEVSADALAAYREARKRIELDVGHTLDDDAALRMLAHYALGGPGDPGRAAYQIAMTICEQCGRGTRDGAGRELVVEQPQIEAAGATRSTSARPTWTASPARRRRTSPRASAASCTAARTAAARCRVAARRSFSRSTTSSIEPTAAPTIRRDSS